MLEYLLDVRTGQTIEREYIPSPEPPAPDPAEVLATWRASASLTIAQTLIMLVGGALITDAEGEAWLTGSALPADVETLIASLPEGQRFAARARALRPSVVLRLDPIVLGLAALRGITDEALDQLFRDGRNV